MWIKLTRYCKNDTTLINTDNIICVLTGQEDEEYEGVTLVCFIDGHFIAVEETVKEIEQLALFGRKL